MEILNFKIALATESHLAEFSIHIPLWEVTFNKFKIRRNKNGHLFVAAPSFVDAGQQWHSFVEFSKTKKEAFDRKVLELVAPLMNKVDN